MKVGDLVKHNDGTIGIIVEVKEEESNIFVEEQDQFVARVLWSDGLVEERWYGFHCMGVIA